MLTVEKPAVDAAAPAMVAVLDWPALIDLSTSAPLKFREVGPRAIERPQTSLLRMHCALIV